MNITIGYLQQEIAFGRLKAHWHRLAKQIDMHVDNVPHIIAACCVLHNVCEIHHDSFNEEWLRDVDLDQHDNVPNTSTQSSTTGHGGDQIRTTLMDYFNQD